MSIILANFGKYAISDCPFIMIVYYVYHIIINIGFSLDIKATGEPES